jgi:hypothetical protein
MLIMSLVLTIALLAIAYGLARTSARYFAVGILCGLGIFACWPLVMFPAHSLTSLLCFLAAIGCAIANASPRRFLQVSLVLATVSYLFVTAGALLHVSEMNRIRAEFPVESMADRLSYENKAAPVAVRDGSGRVSDNRASPAATQGKDQIGVNQTPSDALLALEGLVESEGFRENARYHFYLRQSSLRRLHEDSVFDFIDSPGFGVSRRIEPRRQDIVLPEVEPVPQPPAEYVPPDRAPAGSAGDGPASVKATPIDKTTRSQLSDLHDTGFVDFVNPGGFGYIKDREHVAGFQPHQFRAMPRFESNDRQARWQVQRLELVSLLKFDEPAVYLSDHLPRMDELREAKTRPLDDFEKRSLNALRAGKDLELEQSSNRVRMLGSIRSLEQCTKCHHVTRGELLGAFSYVLKRVAESE